MGTVIEYLLKEPGTASTGESDSFEIVLNRVLNQVEGTKGDQTGVTKSPPLEADATIAESCINRRFERGHRRAAVEQAWSRG